jgi:hypothetical protein
MSSTIKCTCKGIYGRRISVKGTEPHTPPPPPLTHCIRVYNILIHTGKGGGVELNQREGERGNISQSWVEKTVMTESPVYKL